MGLLSAGILYGFFSAFLFKGVNGQSHAIIHPKLFRIDSEEMVVVNLYGYGEERVVVHASLTDYPRRGNIFSRKDVNGNADQPISFTVKASTNDFGEDQTTAIKKVEMNVVIHFTSGRHRDISKKMLIYLTGESDYIFVQTDRPIYRPGEIVLIRAVPLDYKMLPLRREAFEVTIKTPEGVGIWKKVYVLPASGFIDAEYEIPNGPPLGLYFVEVKSATKTHTSNGSTEFKVDKYVLPTYNVELELEQSTVKPDGEIRGKFSAKYSYGEPVVGSYALSATLHIPGVEEITFYKKPSGPGKWPGFLRDGGDGTESIRIRMNLIRRYTNLSWPEIVGARATVSIVVSVMGKAEGILESASKEGILVTDTPYEIDMSQSSKYFVPSLVHDLKVLVRDVVTKEPVSGIPVRLTVDGNPVRARVKTDDSGIAQQQVQTRPNSNSLHIIASTDAPDLDRAAQARASFTIERHQSNHGYLKMSAKTSYAAVGTESFVRFKTTGFRPNEIRYMVLSRGLILLSGKRTVGSTTISEPIRITREMSPSIRVVGYFMHGDNIVSDSVTIDVEDVCISENLTITVVPEVIRPGEPVDIRFKGEPGSTIGTSAVDRAAYFLHDKGRLNRHKMIEKMKAFDMGCSASGGSTPINVFEEAGLACITAVAGTISKFDLQCSETEEAKRKKRSLIELVEGHDSVEKKLIKRCFRDGRKENLADLRCHVRKNRIYLLGFVREDLCIRAFEEGCLQGESIRNSSAFRAATQRTGVQGMDVESQSANMRRTNFNEGWFWSTIEMNREGTATGRPAPPHSITTYDIDAISLHDTEGFCVAKPAELKVFKDFFIQLYLPYSVKVMEQVQIRAAFFNYHQTRDREMEIRISVHESLCTQGTPGEVSKLGTLTVPSQSSKSLIFSMIPLSAQEQVHIELEARPVSELDKNAGDTIKRYLRVEPPGSEIEFSGSFPLDPGQNNVIDLNFPDDNVLPGSKRCWIYGFMNYLGPIVEFDPISETPRNLKGAIKMPYGCGEQNMMVMGPNVFAFKYLEHVGDPMPKDRAAVESHIIAGYTRQQSHRNNGKWSVYSSRPPTIWINAYVDKVFLHAREIWEDMDIQPICESLDWLALQQRGDSFSEQQHATYYTINVAEGGDVALTAYVLIAVAETSTDCPSASTKDRILSMKQKATRYLRGTVTQRANPYTAAIVAYALALVDPNHYQWQTTTANRRLLRLRRQQGDESFWQSRQDPGNTIDIETTAYALLAQVTLAKPRGNRVPQRTVDMINQIANWMVRQQNDKGGFKSSQDTVIAIQSMTEYAKWIHDIRPPPSDPHLEVTLTARGTDWHRGHPFSLDGRHEFYRKELEIPAEIMNGTRSISAAVRGVGRGSMSYRCIYRSTRNSDTCAFDLNAFTQRVGQFGADGVSEAAPGEGKEVIKLVIEVSKNTEGDSRMAIIDITLLSGFRPVESTLEDLKNSIDAFIDDFETFDQKVILYVNTIQHDEPLRVGFKLIQDVEVTGVSPAKIIVYDYYDPDTSCAKFYSVPGGSPLIRTSCNPGSLDGSGERLCQCVEGGCPKCRSREDQLLRTCDGRRCNRCDTCESLRNTVCRRDYGLMITVLSTDNHTMPEFVKIRGRVEEVVHTKNSDTRLVKNQERTFIIRRDCFEKCRDEESMRDLEHKEYIVPGRVYLVRGRKPEKRLKSNGREEFDYFLDRNAMVERTLSQEKCGRLESRRRKCRGNTGEKCVKLNTKLAICDNQREMREAVLEGCD